VKGTGKYLHPSLVKFSSDQKPVEASTGLPLVAEWEKMSKSKYNGADPGEVATSLYLSRFDCLKSFFFNHRLFPNMDQI